MKNKSADRTHRRGGKPGTHFHRVSQEGKEGVMRRRTRKGALQAPPSEAVSGVSEQPVVARPDPQASSAYVRIFERLFRSFRMHMFESIGDRSGEAIIRAEKKICLLAPEYDREALTDETAPLIVDVVEQIVRNASVFRRPKLRRAAIVLIADLYNKQYQILEERSAIDRVEQVYYRLKN
jgi:hypothetical protein